MKPSLNFRTQSQMILLLVCLGTWVTNATAVEFKIVARVLDSVALKQVLKIEGDLATVKEDDEDEVEQFNLKDMSWFDSNTDKWVTVAQCKEWAAQAKEDAAKREDPAFSHEFWLWSLDPVFKVERNGDVLRLNSGHVDYIVDGSGPKTEFNKFYRYLFLNAYKKAMLDKKPPPFYELKAIAEMVKLERIPRSYSVTKTLAMRPKVVVKIEFEESKP